MEEEEEVQSETESDTEYGSVTAFANAQAPGPAVVVNAILPRVHGFVFEMGGSETILDLKKMISRNDTCPVERMIARVGRTVMSDEKTLLECGAQASGRFEVSIDFVGPERPVEVLVLYGRKWAPVVVDDLDKVRDLPRVLDEMGFSHPPCFFCIHYERRLRKRRVMDNTRTFRWHRVVRGDEIELFPGCVIKDI